MNSRDVSREFNPAAASASDLEGASFEGRERAKHRVIEFESNFKNVQAEVSKGIIGMREEIKLVLASIYTGGHVLMEGTPGLAKTLLANSVATALGLDFQRIQFTPDLLPGDITGSLVQTKDREFTFRKGPIFSNIVLADEINRSTPKTQAALLEAMQEKQVTADGHTYKLPDCFLVLATQNPLESAGTYPLPDAQMDRFALKVDVRPPSQEELRRIFRLTTNVDLPKVQAVFTGEEASAQILSGRQLVRSVAVSSEIEDLAAKMIVSLDPRHEDGIDLPLVKENVWYGPSPRGGQAALLLAKVHALLDGRMHVSQEDLKHSLVPALRHRLAIKPEQMREDLTSDRIIEEAMAKILP